MLMRRGILAMLIGLMLVGCGESNPRAVLNGEAFAVRYHITLPGSHPEAYAVHQQITDLLNEIDEQASQWRDDSWVSRFNRGSSLEPVAVPEHVWAMLVVAERVHRGSGGAFDITAGPLVELWGLGPSRPEGDAPPSEMQIALALVNRGMDKLVLDHDAKTISKRAPGVTIDLSAVAKGYAIDRMAVLLEAGGHKTYLIEFGGEVYGKDLRASSEGWVIEIDNGTPGGNRSAVTLRNQALATSGTSFRQRKLSDGRIVSHLVDPRTGMPIPAPTKSVTVVAGRGLVADAWATALAVDQSESVLEAAERAGVTVVGD